MPQLLRRSDPLLELPDRRQERTCESVHELSRIPWDLDQRAHGRAVATDLGKLFVIVVSINEHNSCENLTAPKSECVQLTSCRRAANNSSDGSGRKPEQGRPLLRNQGEWGERRRHPRVLGSGSDLRRWREAGRKKISGFFLPSAGIVGQLTGIVIA